MSISLCLSVVLGIEIRNVEDFVIGIPIIMIIDYYWDAYCETLHEYFNNVCKRYCAGRLYMYCNKY